MFESSVMMDVELMLVVGKLCLLVPQDKILVCGYKGMFYVPLKALLVLFH